MVSVLLSVCIAIDKGWVSRWSVCFGLLGEVEQDPEASRLWIQALDELRELGASSVSEDNLRCLAELFSYIYLYLPEIDIVDLTNDLIGGKLYGACSRFDVIS